MGKELLTLAIQTEADSPRHYLTLNRRLNHKYTSIGFPSLIFVCFVKYILFL